MTRRQSLAALAKSRGIVLQPRVYAAHLYDGFERRGWRATPLGIGELVLYVLAPTRAAATAGLRAALFALPARKEKKR